MGKSWSGHGVVTVRLERVSPKELRRLNIDWTNVAQHASGFECRRNVRSSCPKETVASMGRCIPKHDRGRWI